jgi:hypothetical protein
MNIKKIKNLELKILALRRITNPDPEEMYKLNVAFNWDASPEGHAFWEKVNGGVDMDVPVSSTLNKPIPMRGTRPHYENPSSKYDVIDIIKDYDLNFNRGNIVKYVLRCGKKDNEVQELEKAKDYIERELTWLREQQAIWIENNK